MTDLSSSQTASLPDTSRRELWRIEKTALVFLGVATAGSALLASWAITLGVVIGGVLALVNFRVLTVLVREGLSGAAEAARTAQAAHDVAQAEPGDGAGTSRTAGRTAVLGALFILKNLILLGLIWTLAARGYVDILALGAGFSTLVVAVTVRGLWAGLKAT